MIYLGISCGIVQFSPATVLPPDPPRNCELSRASKKSAFHLYCDLVLIPSRSATSLTAYQNAVAGVIARFNGYMAKFMGDGVEAYFGWPVAREEDVQQAIRAGHVKIEEVGKLSARGARLFHLRSCTDRARILTDRVQPMGTGVDALREALDRVQEFRFGPDWQRGQEKAVKANARFEPATGIPDRSSAGRRDALSRRQ